MKKIIKRKLHISTYSRDFIDYINHEFYSHDKHNAFFEFTMEQLPTDNVVVLFYFQKTKRYAEIKGTVEDNKVTIEFDTSLITTNETVCGYIYFEKVEQSADVCRFCFNVKVSEIDKLKNAPIVEKETRRLIPMSEIVTKTELQELFKTIEKNGGTYNDTEIRKSITSIEERVQTLENKPDNNTVYDDSDVINRLNELESNASRYITEHQPPTTIEERIKEVESRFNNLSNIYLTSHQSLAHLATNDALNKIEQRVQQLEESRGSQPAVDNHNFATRKELEELRNNQPTVDTSNLATNDKVTEVENRVLALETKEDKDTIYNDEDIKRRLNNLENKTDNFISGVSVNKEGNNVTLTYNYVDGQSKNVSFTDSDTINVAYDDSALKSRLNDLENRTQIDVSEFAKKTDIPQAYDDRELSRRVSALETKEDKDTIYNDEDIKRRLNNLENKTDNFISGVSVNKEGNNVTLTYNYVDGQAKNVSFTDSDTINIAYDDSALKTRLNDLENRPQVDVTKLVSKDELPNLIQHQPLTDYALKSELYNDNDLRNRVSALETKEDKDTIYNDEDIKRRLNNLENKTDNFISGVSVNKEGNNVTLTYNYVDGQAKNVSFTDSDTVNVAYDDSALRERLTSLENRPQIDVTTLVSKAELPNLIQHQSLEEYAKKSELPTPYNDTEVKQRLTALENRPTSQSEMRGTGMPNGVVEAPIGATYIDTAKTNGAIKWMKTTDGGNTGWKVIHGDTGWVLGWQEDKGNNKNRMYFRRINDVVHVKFEPKISDDVNAHEYNLILDTGGSDIFGKLSIQGFQSVDNIVQTIFKRTIDIPGDTYSAENSEASQGCGAVCLHYVYNNYSTRELELQIVTSQFSSAENHVNQFSYLTEDEWPTELPTL